jgi:RNA polymerase sigma-70 factor (ECF subfamily)
MDGRADTELVESARAGDARALEQLLLRYQPQLWRYARRMCGSLADAEDVLQDALLGAVRGFTQFRGEAAFRTWLFSILRHACFRERRRGAAAAGSANRGTPGAEPEDESAVAADAPGPERQASSRQLAAAVVHAIEELEPTQREALVLRDIEGLSAVEVAELTGSSVDAVKSRLHRARRTVQLRAAQLAEPLLTEPLRPAAASSCPDILQLYSERLEGDVSPDLCERLQEHVDHCPACQATCDSLKRTLQLCSTVPVGPVPDHIQQAVQHALRRTSAPR